MMKVQEFKDYLFQNSFSTVCFAFLLSVVIVAGAFIFFGWVSYNLFDRHIPMTKVDVLIDGRIDVAIMYQTNVSNVGLNFGSFNSGPYTLQIENSDRNESYTISNVGSGEVYQYIDPSANWTHATISLYFGNRLLDRNDISITELGCNCSSD